jgi:hypothetical protein
LVQRQAEEVQKSYPAPPRYVLSSDNWQPLPISLDKVETLDHIAIGRCSDEEKKNLTDKGVKQCNSKPDKGGSVREAAQVLSNWVVVPKEYWENNLSHPGFPDYRRVLKRTRLMEKASKTTREDHVCMCDCGIHPRSP